MNMRTILIRFLAPSVLLIGANPDCLGAQIKTGSDTPTVVPATVAPYLLRPGDEIEIMFFYNPELNQHATIRPDGRISMPLLGEFEVAGRTVGDLTKELEKAYQSELKHASIYIQVRSFTDQMIFVGGEVVRPGALPLLRRSTSAMEAIFLAGGLKDSAARGSIFVLRRGPEGKVESFRVAMGVKKDRIPESANFQLQPLDVVIVAESGISRLDRVVDNYVRKLSPVLLTGGFTYLFGPAGAVIP
jgi:polysaccharide export outer membrane protein